MITSEHRIDKTMEQKKKDIKIIISGGGTGGHIFPAIAIANALKEINSSVEILFVGAEGKMEMEKVPKAGYTIIGLPIMGLQRKLTWKNLAFPFKLLRSLMKARKIINEFKPDVAVGVGGYASGPLLSAATKKGIPALIQEQNSYPGITNKLLARKVQKICVAYEKMERFFPESKIILTGNPVRQDIVASPYSKAEARGHFGLDATRKTVLVIGGSLGARTINESIHMGLEKLVQHDIQLIWQTGKNYANKASDVVKNYTGKGVYTSPFIADMSAAYAAADVVISRAGASSIAELCLVKKATIFVPSPNVAEDHQTKNAMALVDKDAAILVKDNAANASLIPAVLDLMNDEQKQEQLSHNMVEMAYKDAATRIAHEVLKLIAQD